MRISFVDVCARVGLVDLAVADSHRDEHAERDADRYALAHADRVAFPHADADPFSSAECDSHAATRDPITGAHRSRACPVLRR